MMRRPFIAGNWKMYKSNREAVSFVRHLIPALGGIHNIDILVAPQFTALFQVAEALDGTSVKVAAQNIWWEDEGAYTGEVAPGAVRDTGATHVIIGHSERRHILNESDDMVCKKIKAALRHDLTPIFCVGELISEREAGLTFDVLSRQLSILATQTEEEMKRIIIAYEPVWAIGTGKTATPGQAEEAHYFIRNTVNQIFGGDISESVRILYGGSVKPDNIKALMSEKDIDGALIGGASLKAESFISIATQASEMV